MVIRFDKEDIDAILRFFGDDLSKLHITKITVNQEKKAVVLSKVPIGELLNSSQDKDTGARSLIIEVNKESEIEND